MQVSLEGKVAIVTGGGSGIGAATSRTMAAAGASVLVADLDLETASRVAEEITAAGGAARPFAVDVGDEAQIEAMVAAAAEAFGGLDILHNNAAVSRSVVPDGPLDRMRSAWWDQTFAVNLRGPMLACRAAVPLMAARGGGSIVNTSSTVSLLATGQLFAYSAAKAGLNQLTVNVAALFGRRNIRCNAVAPGTVATRRGMSALNERTFGSMARETLLPRVVLPQDIANLVTFLASDAAGAITGQVIPVDGGLVSHFGGWADLMREVYGDAFDDAAASWDETLALVERLAGGA